MYKKELTDLSVLVVDADPLIIKSITRILKDATIKKVTSSCCALEALEKLNSEIDIIIFDLKMPALDGIQLIRRLNKMQLKTNLILISEETEYVLQAAENIANERKVNFLGSLQKPIKSSKLIPILNRDIIETKATLSSFEPVSLEIEFRKALQNKTLSVHYQPQMNESNGEIVGIEALARWNHKEMGMIPPSLFIPLAEKLALINILTMQTNEIVFKEFPLLLHENPSLTVSINYSLQCLNDLNLPEKIEEMMGQHSLVASQVIIEVTESVITQDLTTSLDILARLRLRGFGLSIDDFGTGFSTLEQVHRIPFTELKIDRAFVHGSKQKKVQMAILESSIALAKKLDMRTVAEGVENIDDLEVVRGLGCDLVQGYYYAKPMPINELHLWISNRKKDNATMAIC